MCVCVLAQIITAHRRSQRGALGGRAAQGRRKKWGRNIIGVSCKCTPKQSKKSLFKGTIAGRGELEGRSG